jgi:chromosome segregation ATPase
MDRLTERFSNGQAAVLGCGSNCKYDFKYCSANENCPTLNAIYEKLAQYEETGLTPDNIKKLVAEDKAPCRPNYEEELKIRYAEIAELKHHLSTVRDERSKIGLEREQALKNIDELNGTIKFLEGQIEAYQYCMNCRR